MDLVLPLARKAMCNNFMILVSVAHMMNYCDLKHQQQWLHQTTQLTGIQSSDMGLVQAISDNFDANITSSNGLKSSHALALLMIQVCPNTEEGQEDTTIKRLKKENVKDSTPSAIPISYYHGPKKPEMPEEVLRKCVLPLKVLAQQRILVQRSKFHDSDLLRSVATKPSTPEFGCFNTKLTRMQGQGLKPRTKAMYTPLIDITPSDPTTMKSAMLEAKRLTKKAGQATTLFTAGI